MATALDIIKRSMRLLGVYAIGEEPTADESRDGLAALNALLESLANSRQLVYARTLDSVALTAGQASVTVGPSGAFVSSRPVQVLGDTYLSFNGTDYPLEMLTLAQYNAIGVKTVTGLPSAIYVQPDMPNLTVTLFAVPDQAMTLKLWSIKPVTSLPTLTTTVTLPPGYDRMLAHLLAEDLAAEYQVQLPPSVMKIAMQSRRLLKRTNLEVPQLDMPSGVPTDRGFLDIREWD